MKTKDEEIEELNDKLKAAKKPVDDETVADDMNQLEDEIEKIRSENATLIEQVTLLKAEVNRQSDVISRVSTENESVLSDVTRLKEEKQELTDGITNLQNEKSKLEQTIGEKDAQIENLQTTVQKLNQENQTLLNSSEKNQFVASSGLQQANAEISRLQESLSSEKQENDTLRKKMAESEKAMTSEFIAQEQLKMSLANAQAQNEKLEQEVRNMRSEMERIKSSKGETSKDADVMRLKIVELNERVRRGDVSLTSMAELVKEKQSHIEDLRKEVSALRSTTSSYFSKLEYVTSSHHQERDVIRSKYDDMESAHRRLLDENKRLRTLVAHKNMNETSQGTELEETKTKLYEAENQLDIAHARVEQLEALLQLNSATTPAQESSRSKPNQRKRRAFLDSDSRATHSVASPVTLHSLPEVPEAGARSSVLKNVNRKKETSRSGGRKTQVMKYDADSLADSLTSGGPWELRNYRHATSYSKRFESRPSKLKRSGVVTQLE